MKATLSFSLPEEESECKAAMQGREAKRVLWDIDQRLRALLKHGSPGVEAANLAEEIRQIIRDSREDLLDE